ncbi:MAG: TrmB family transcriptional regulator [Halobacteriota archaeon]
MTGEDDFITRLMGFGLTEKEAHAYFYLLKYGPKTPSPLAKALHTYREDMHRTLNSLIDKGMVRPSLDSPTVYTAVELENALESALKKHESELREMERRKQELEELSRQQRFRPSDEVGTFKILKSMSEVMTVSLSTLTSAEKEWIAVVPPIMTVFSVLFVMEDDKKFLDRGGRIRFITDITYPMIEIIRQHLDAGMEVHHFGKYEGLLFGVFDGKIGMSAINAANLTRVSLSVPVSVLWTDDRAYAQYLISTFELLWQQSVPAEERIQELLKQGPRQADE